MLPIVTGADSSVLRAPTQKIPQVTKQIKKLVKDMQETVKDANGLGLAAPQIGQSLRLCLVRMNKKMTPLINPEITWKSDDTDSMEEGCLSLPGIHKDVIRAVSIRVSYTDLDGKHQDLLLHDLDARVVQHEVDHLEGILIIDY